jgi:oligopeptide transport system substrate-binding protein
MVARVKGLAAAGCLAIVVGAGAGCGANPYPEEPPNTLHLDVQQEVKGLDPSQADEEMAGTLVQNVYDTLYEYHHLKRPFELVPCLAEAMPEVTDEEKTYRIRLKKGVRFVDDPCFVESAGRGREMTADDVVFCLKRLMDAKTDSPGTWLLERKVEGLDDFHEASKKFEKHRGARRGYPDVAGLRVVDRHTVEVRLVEPYPQLVWVLAMGYTSIYPPEAVAHYGDEFLNHAVGTGPYRVVEFSNAQRTILERNPTYREDLYPSDGNPGDAERGRLDDAGKRLPLNDRVVVTVFKELQPRWLYFMSGFLDRALIPKDNFAGAVDPKTMELLPDLAARGIRLDKDPKLEVIYDCFNMLDPVFGQSAGEKGRAIRCAMHLANDEDWANEHLYNRRVSPLAGPLIQEFSEFDPSFVNPWKRRPGETRAQALDRARAILAEAGYPGGRGIPEIAYEVNDDSTSGQHFMAFQRDMAEVGIRVRPNQVTWSEMIQRTRLGKAQMWGLAWGADYPDPQNFMQLFYGPNKAPGPNGSNYQNPELDRLYERAQAMSPGPERTALYRDMQRIVVDDCVWIFKYRRLQFNLMQPWLHGYRYNDLSYKYFKYCRVDSRERGRDVEDLNRAKPLPMLVFLGVFAVILVGSWAFAQRSRRGW